jgi:hypothetical protein
MAMPTICSTCTYFALAGTTADGVDTGVCRRDGPSTWKTISGNDWCGEYNLVTPAPPGVLAYVGLAAAGTPAGYYLFALRNDGSLYASANGGAFALDWTLPLV